MNEGNGKKTKKEKMRYLKVSDNLEGELMTHVLRQRS